MMPKPTSVEPSRAIRAFTSRSRMLRRTRSGVQRHGSPCSIACFESSAIASAAGKVATLQFATGPTLAESGHLAFDDNVKKLRVAWVHHPGRSTRGLQSMPLVQDGVLYYTGSYSRVWALDAATGRPLWSYFPKLNDDLVAAQKEVIVATWKLDRRSRAANGAKSEQDIRAVSKAELELKTKVEQASSAFRQSNMRDPRARPNGRGAPPPRAGQSMPEEDAMTVAASAMGRAVEALDHDDLMRLTPEDLQVAAMALGEDPHRARTTWWGGRRR